jgi:glycosyltransferase involved in cell wall biosynthesis
MTLRVLHAPALVGGNPARLADAERKLGLASRCISFHANPFGYPVDEQLDTPAQGRFAFELQRWRLLWRALREFDIVHFNFGQTLFPNLFQADLPLLKAAGKALFMTYQGDDARQGDYCKEHFEITFATRVPEGYYSAESDAAKRRRISWLARHANGIYALNPDLLHVLPPQARFLPYANVDIEDYVPVAGRGSQTLLVVHAPSHRAVKGTDLIVDAVTRLRAEGHAIELALAEGVSNQAARSMYAQADVCVDQLYAGWYGGVAVEMMALGKPVVCYLREGDLHFLPAGMRAELPLIHARPDTILEVLRDCVLGPRERLRGIGVRSRAYVEGWHDPLKIAAQLKRDYERAFGHAGMT